jgi:hypothetical protein
LPALKQVKNYQQNCNCTITFLKAPSPLKRDGAFLMKKVTFTFINNQKK